MSVKISTIMDAFPEFKLLRMLYHAVEVMYEKDTLEEAEAAWDEWQELLPPSNEAEYSKWCDLYSVDKACFESFRSLSRAASPSSSPTS